MSIDSSRGPAPITKGGPVHAAADQADSLLRAAWASHRSEREAVLRLDATLGYIDPDALRTRLDSLAQQPPLSQGRQIQAHARAQGASIETDELASDLALLLQDAILCEDIPQAGDTALITRWHGPDSAPELADDALVLAHRERAVEDGQQHEFWIQWRDSAGAPAGYCMVFVRPDPVEGFESLAHAQAAVTLRVERIDPAVK